MRPLLCLLAALAVACADGPERPLPDAGTLEDGGPPDAGTVPDPGPRRGVLQFLLRHNLTTEDCLATGDCGLTIEADPAERAVWIEALAAASTQAVLHYDRAIPWPAFEVDPPEGEDPVAFYDGRIDAELRGYLDDFATYFARFDARYLAVSPLGGVRDRVAAMRNPDGTETLAPDACPTLTATTTVDFSGTRVQIEPAYRRFVLYLAKKLEPTDLALVVEANLFHRFCPEAWPGLATLYHRLYAAARAELGPEVRLFATLTLLDLLGYDGEVCNPPVFSACGQPVTDPPAPDPDRCFPLVRAPLDDLAEDGHLDLLALSVYPDALAMQPPGAPEQRLTVLPPESDGTGPCIAEAKMAPLVDPFEALGRLGWPGRVALAEVSARSCPTWIWLPTETDAAVVRIGGTPESQAFWMERVLGLAAEGRLAFVNQSFLQDYLPLGTWMPRRGALDPGLFNLFNAWPCSGLYDQGGVAKPLVAPRWNSFE